MAETRQLPLDLPVVERYGRDDWIVGGANAAATALVERWPDWPGDVVVVVGPEGSGKSHLARIFADHAGATIVAAADLGRLDPTELAAAPALLAISAQAGTLASAPAGSSNEAYIQNLLETDFNLDKWNEQIMLAAIQQSGGNISDAARKLGISRPTLAYQLKKYRQEDLNP